MRSGVGTETFWRKSGTSYISGWSAPSMFWPISSERMALLKLSSKVRPMAMTSPTAFMRVVRVASVPLNFSKAKRGTLTTQ